MSLQYIYQISRLGAAEPRDFVKPAASAAGKTLSVPPAASLGMAMPQCAKAWGLCRVPTLTHTTRRACSAACLGEIYRPLVPAAGATGCKKFAPPALFACYNIF